MRLIAIEAIYNSEQAISELNVPLDIYLLADITEGE